jgi:cellobiose-specific phosphotransferase system component IIB
VARPKAGAKLSVFKGREARLNQAIIQSLALLGPQTIYDIYKAVKKVRGLGYTRYASVNKRVRTLQVLHYVEITGTKITKAGFQTAVFEPTARAYLAILLRHLELEWFMEYLDEASTVTILATILNHLE